MLSICCKRKHLEEGLLTIEKAADTSHIIPVLSNFLFRTVQKNTDIFRLSEHSIQRLKSYPDIAEEDVEKLQSIVDIDYPNEESLLKAVEETVGVEFAVSKKKEILEHTQDFVFIAASDTVLVSSTYVPALVEQQGELTIPPKLLEITKHLSDDDLFIQEKDLFWMDVFCGSFKSELVGLDSKNFVEIPKREKRFNVKIEQQLLKTILAKTRIAISSGDSRPALNGLSMALIGDKLHFASSDGHRLAYQHTEDIEVPITDETTDFDVVLPAKAVAEIIKACNKEGDFVKINVVGTKAHFYIGLKTTIITNLIDAQFFDYRTMILPQVADESRFQVVFPNKQHITQVINRVALLTGVSGQINMRINKGDNHVQMFINKQTIGSAGESVSATIEGLQDEVFMIGYNYKYLLNGFAILDGTPKFSLKEERDVTFITSDAKEDEGLIYMVMPMRLDNLPQTNKKDEAQVNETQPENVSEMPEN